MAQPIFYISGKISGEPDLNKAKFDRTALRLKFLHGADLVVFVPHNLPAVHDGSWTSYMRVCVRYLTRATTVCVLDDWQNSRGAIIEVLIAWVLRIQVIQLNDREPINIEITQLLRFKLIVKLLLNRFANAKEYQAKQPATRDSE